MDDKLLMSWWPLRQARQLADLVAHMITSSPLLKPVIIQGVLAQHLWVITPIKSIIPLTSAFEQPMPVVFLPVGP